LTQRSGTNATNDDLKKHLKFYNAPLTPGVDFDYAASGVCVMVVATAANGLAYKDAQTPSWWTTDHWSSAQKLWWDLFSQSQFQISSIGWSLVPSKWGVDLRFAVREDKAGDHSMSGLRCPTATVHSTASGGSGNPISFSETRGMVFDTEWCTATQLGVRLWAIVLNVIIVGVVLAGGNWVLEVLMHFSCCNGCWESRPYKTLKRETARDVEAQQEHLRLVSSAEMAAFDLDGDDAHHVSSFVGSMPCTAPHVNRAGLDMEMDETSHFQRDRIHSILTKQTPDKKQRSTMHGRIKLSKRESVMLSRGNREGVMVDSKKGEGDVKKKKRKSLHNVVGDNAGVGPAILLQPEAFPQSACPAMSGVLDKRRNISSWERRFFRLRNQYLVYFSKSLGEKNYTTLSGAYDLREVDRVVESKRGMGLEIFFKKKIATGSALVEHWNQQWNAAKPVFLRANKQVDVRRWIRALQMRLRYIQNQMSNLADGWNDDPHPAESWNDAVPPTPDADYGPAPNPPRRTISALGDSEHNSLIPARADGNLAGEVALHHGDDHSTDRGYAFPPLPDNTGAGPSVERREARRERRRNEKAKRHVVTPMDRAYPPHNAATSSERKIPEPTDAHFDDEGTIQF